MKKLLLSFLLVSTVGVAMSQCVPNEIYADSTFGVWPDTTTNFAPAGLDQPYTQQLDLIVPENAEDLGPGFPSLPLDSVQFEGVTGLPPGLTYDCNSQTPAECTYLPQQLGCGVISGTPTQAGVYELTLDVRGYSNLNGFVVDAAHTFTGYRIIVLEGLSVAEASMPAIGQVRNVPNPFTSRTAFEFQLAKAMDVDLRVFNLLGEELWSQTVHGKAGMNRIPFDSDNLQEGIYLYKVGAGKETFTGRMVLHR